MGGVRRLGRGRRRCKRRRADEEIYTVGRDVFPLRTSLRSSDGLDAPATCEQIVKL